MPADLDQLILESLRNTYGASQPNLSGGARGVGGELRRGGGRGTPGYPVPPEMEDGDEERFPFMKEGEAPLAKSPVMDDPTKDPNKGFSEWGDELAEAGEKKEPKGIPHLEDLDPDEFLQFLKKYQDLPLNGGLEVSEKVDGSAKITFGVENGKLWVQSKNGPRRRSPKEWPDAPWSQALLHAHEALASKEDQIRKWWDVSGNDVVISAEVLYTHIPNSIEYGPNVIMIHGVLGPGGVQSEAQSKKIADDLIRSTGKVLSDGNDQWRFEYKRIVHPQDVMVDTKAEYDSVKEIYDELKKLRPDRLRAAGKGPYQAALKKFKSVQLALKQKLVGQLRKQKSVYGPPGGDVEGLVFRDLESGKLTKLVDKELFTKLNQFNWRWRELIDRGAKEDDKWRAGVLAHLRQRSAQEVIGVPAIISPSFMKQLERLESNIEYPTAADTPAKRADYLLEKWVEETKAFHTKNPIEDFAKIVRDGREALRALDNRWDREKAAGPNVTVKGQVRKMDTLVIRRTDEAFRQAHQALAGLEKSVGLVAHLHGPNRNVALLKLFLGHAKMERVTALVSGDEPQETEEAIVREVMESLVESPPGARTNRLGAIRAAARKGKSSFGTVDAAVEACRDLLAKHGMRPGKKLGEGTYGIAYDIGGGKVLKVTSDELEARSSNHIRGKKLKHVVHIERVFKLPNVHLGEGGFEDEDEDTKTYLYGIVEEKLKPISDFDKKEFDLVSDLLQACKAGRALLSGDYERVLAQVREHIKDRDVQRLMDELMRQYQLPEIIRELADQHVEFLDYHQGNLMLRGKDYVIIDLGLSQSPGTLPPVLETVVQGLIREFSGRERVHGLGPTPDRQEYVGVDANLVNHTEDGTVDKYARSIQEGAADTVGVTIGRYQPFHRGHAEVIRSLARTHTKVVVLVAGNTPDKKNPFSYETRLQMMEASLPDVWRKLEVYKASAGGRNSGFVPFILSDVIRRGSPSLKGDTAVEILVGPDRFEQMRQQLARARSYREQDRQMDFDPDLAVVQKLPGVKNDDDTDRISGTRVREAIVANDRETAKKMLDPHLTSNSPEFEEVFAKMREELGKTVPLREDLKDIGTEGIARVLDVHAAALKAKKHIDVARLRVLGKGQMGVAYDMGGGKVLKVTTDMDEAQTSLSLVGKGLAHVVRIFDVFRMTDPKQQKTPVVAIIRENLHPLSDTEENELNDIVDLIRDGDVINTTATGDFEKTMTEVRKVVTRDIRRELSLPEQAPTEQEVEGNKRELRARSLVNQKMTELEGRLRHYQVDQMMAELRSLGVMFADYKGANIMKRGSAYALSDLGGRTKSTTQPPVLEKVTEAIIQEIGITFNSNSPGSTQSGLRAGSSGWSSPQDMYTDDDIRDFREDPDEFELWSDKLKNMPTARAIGEAVLDGIVGEGPKKRKVSPSVARWVPWSDRSKDIPFDSSDREVGPGELKVGAELGLQKQTGNKGKEDYDLFDPNDPSQKWEVKAVIKRELGQIGAHGRETVQEGIDTIRTIVSQMEDFLESLGEEGRGLLQRDFGFDVSDIESWVLQNKKRIDSGEIGIGAVRELTEILKSVQKYLAHPAHLSIPTMKLGLGKDKWDISIEQYIQIMTDVLRRPRKEIDAGTVDIARAHLRHPFFRNDGQFTKMWRELAVPSEVFPKWVTGVVLVQTDGYMVVPRAKMDDILEFQRITKGLPKLGIKKKE